MDKPYFPPLCMSNHHEPASHILSLRVESPAPPVILSRALQNSNEMAISEEQIRRFLDIATEYHDESVKVSIAFANVTSELESERDSCTIEEMQNLLTKN